MRKIQYVIPLFVLLFLQSISFSENFRDTSKLAIGLNEGYAIRYWFGETLAIEESYWFDYDKQDPYYSSRNDTLVDTIHNLKTNLIYRYRKTPFVNYNMGFFIVFENRTIEYKSETEHEKASGNMYRIGISPELEFFIPEILPNLSIDINILCYIGYYDNYPTDYFYSSGFKYKNDNFAYFSHISVNKIGIRYYF